MDNQRFDALAKRIGSGNRRDLLKGLLGLGGIALTGTLLVNDASAARRGYSSPSVPVLIGCPEFSVSDGRGGCRCIGGYQPCSSRNKPDTVAACCHPDGQCCRDGTCRDPGSLC